MSSSHSFDGESEQHEVLTFTLGAEEYAIDILSVQEISGYGRVTAIANAPPFIKGVINLRGDIVPIIDLRIKFGLGHVSYNEFTVVIILNVGQRVVGVVVDAVSDVVTLAAGEVKPPPQLSSALDLAYLKGVAAHGEQMLILVDIERLITSDEMGLVDNLAASR